jgi:ribosomal protein L20
MTRVKTGVTTKARHKKVLKAAKGYFGSKHRLYKTAKEQLMHSGQYAFRDRRQKKREFRSMWIVRINAGCREEGISYSRFIEGLTKAGVEVNRKMLSEIAINNPAEFKAIVKVAKEGLEGKATKVEAKIEKGVEVISAEKTPAKKATKEEKEVEISEEEVEETPKKVAKKTTKK